MRGRGEGGIGGGSEEGMGEENGGGEGELRKRYLHRTGQVSDRLQYR